MIFLAVLCKRQSFLCVCIELGELKHSTNDPIEFLFLPNFHLGLYSSIKTKAVRYFEKSYELLEEGGGGGSWHIIRNFIRERVLGLPTFGMLCNPVGSFEKCQVSKSE